MLCMVVTLIGSQFEQFASTFWVTFYTKTLVVQITQTKLGLKIFQYQYSSQKKEDQVCLILYLTICHKQLLLLMLLFHLTCIGDIALHLGHCCYVLFPMDILNTHSQKFQHHIVDFYKKKQNKIPLNIPTFKRIVSS